MADKAELFRRSLPFSHLISAPGKGLILLKLMRGAEILTNARQPARRCCLRLVHARWQHSSNVDKVNSRRTARELIEMQETRVLSARLAILPLALVELGVTAWYILYWDLFPKYSLRRLLPWLIFVLSGIGIPLLQISIYRLIAPAVGRIDDVYLAMTLAGESALAVVLMFYLLHRRRTRQISTRHEGVTTTE